MDTDDDGTGQPGAALINTAKLDRRAPALYARGAIDAGVFTADTLREEEATQLAALTGDIYA